MQASVETAVSEPSFAPSRSPSPSPTPETSTTALIEAHVRKILNRPRQPDDDCWIQTFQEDTFSTLYSIILRTKAKDRYIPEHLATASSDPNIARIVQFNDRVLRLMLRVVNKHDIFWYTRLASELHTLFMVDIAGGRSARHIPSPRIISYFVGDGGRHEPKKKKFMFPVNKECLLEIPGQEDQIGGHILMKLPQNCAIFQAPNPDKLRELVLKGVDEGELDKKQESNWIGGYLTTEGLWEGGKSGAGDTAIFTKQREDLVIEMQEIAHVLYERTQIPRMEYVGCLPGLRSNDAFQNLAMSDSVARDAANCREHNCTNPEHNSDELGRQLLRDAISAGFLMQENGESEQLTPSPLIPHAYLFLNSQKLRSIFGMLYKVEPKLARFDKATAEDWIRLRLMLTAEEAAMLVKEAGAQTAKSDLDKWKTIEQDARFLLKLEEENTWLSSSSNNQPSLGLEQVPADATDDQKRAIELRNSLIYFSFLRHNSLVPQNLLRAFPNPEKKDRIACVLGWESASLAPLWSHLQAVDCLHFSAFGGSSITDDEERSKLLKLALKTKLELMTPKRLVDYNASNEVVPPKPKGKYDMTVAQDNSSWAKHKAWDIPKIRLELRARFLAGGCPLGDAERWIAEYISFAEAFDPNSWRNVN
ncbi:hypothetical protein BJ508DRAFT_311879 [Ascobolus immersus RN42]|uniref:Uncharacterized protein n=1 Tax=Ascobolus immersus RN42 TaxID=1160509 RepID=A0A3N4HP25_ASCIM|nr:hypothetical protein BJ508DRAFT_311879 [Ascobolus immersus RN42]